MGAKTSAALESRGARVLVVDDHELVGQSLALALRAEGYEARVISRPTAQNVDTALWWKPDLAILDLRLGEYGDGRSFIPTLQSAGTRVIVVTAVSNYGVLSKCYEAGADAVIEKQRPTEVLLKAIDRVLSGEGTETMQDLLATGPRAQVRGDGVTGPFAQLTPRERRVLEFLLDGMSAKTIAETSHVSVWTVRGQIRSILMKLNVRSQIEAVALARRSGWEGDSFTS